MKNTMGLLAEGSEKYENREFVTEQQKFRLALNSACLWVPSSLLLAMYEAY